MNKLIGIPDEEFVRGDIPMTKQEIRTLVIAKAQIQPGEVIIDIGAGTGSLSVEAALQSETGKVYALERRPEGIELIKTNAAKFAVANIEAILGEAPEALSGIKYADVILIGGSGGRLTEILQVAEGLLRVGGRIIITAVTVETLYTALSFLQAKPQFEVEAFGMQVTRIHKVGTSNMFKALNPVYIITCTKGGF